jgi:hypothetical protein
MIRRLLAAVDADRVVSQVSPPATIPRDRHRDSSGQTWRRWLRSALPQHHGV